MECLKIVYTHKIAKRPRNSLSLFLCYFYKSIRNDLLLQGLWMYLLQIYHFLMTANLLAPPKDLVQRSLGLHCFSKKGHENKLPWFSKLQTRQEMEEQENTIRELERSLQAKINPLKLAETRLENRKMRPHMDLCADVPMEGLIAEVQSITNSMTMLRDKLDHAR